MNMTNCPVLIRPVVKPSGSALPIPTVAYAFCYLHATYPMLMFFPPEARCDLCYLQATYPMLMCFPS